MNQISRKVSLENPGVSDAGLSEEISCIVYRVDVFACGSASIISQHIDIEYSFGGYYEAHENTSLFQFICSLCSLPLLQGEQEIILYQREE